MNDEIEVFTSKINSELKELYKEESYGIDPLTILAIINIIYNIYKAIMVIYFPKKEEDIISMFKNPNFLTRLIIVREVRKECKLRQDDQDVIKKAFISVVRNYGEAELSKLISQVKEKRNER